MVVYLTIALLVNFITLNANNKGIIMYVLIVFLFRLKYQLNYSFRYSINKIHLFYDRLSKRLKFRNCYQKFYKFLVTIFLISDYNTGKKRLRY